MKAMFLLFHGFDPSNGISKKIHYQVKALKACGLDTRLVYYEVQLDGHRVWKSDGITIEDLGTGNRAKLRKRFDYSPIISYIKKEDINFIYMRSDHNANPFSIGMVKAVKKMGAKIVMEIPTFPYDQEYVTTRMKVDLLIDKIFRWQLAKHLDGIVTFSNCFKIFGKPTIQISNGIDFDVIPLRSSVHDISKELHLIGVAEIHFWHGYDRMIMGMLNYYKNNPEYKVYFHIVGYFYDRADNERFLKLIHENHLEDYILLHGPKHGKELDNFFEQSDFAIGSLGRHRSGITHIKTLKNREYAARGFSFIYSEIDDDFETQPYVLKAPADETPIDVNRIIDFSRSLTVDPAEIRESVRPLSWNNQIRKVVDAVK